MIAAKLALSGEERHRSWRAYRGDQKQRTELRWHDGTVLSAKVRAFDKSADAGEQDLVVLAVK